MLDETSKLHTINEAYSNGDFVKAKALIDGLLEVSPLSPQGLSARYLRARGYEDGFFGNVELAKALQDYKVLTDYTLICGSDGVLGYARILFEQDRQNNKAEVVELLHKAVELDSNIKAMMMLGLVYDEGFDDSRTASKWFLRAYKHGLPWGLRYYARLQAKSGRPIRAFFAHFIASFTSPVLVLLNGVRSPFK